MRIVFDQRTGRIYDPDGDIDLSPAKIEGYEARWREIKGKYKSVHVYLHVGVHAIGEVLYRYFAMCEDTREEGALYVQLPAETAVRTWVANEFLNEYVGICSPEDLEFWIYILKEHRCELNEDVARFASRNGFPAYFKKAYNVEHHFTDEQVERGEAALKAMGITGPFVCLAARTHRYNNRAGISKDEAGYRSRCMDFTDYGKAIAWLGEQGIQCVKMGRFEDSLDPPIPNCIDYSAYHASDFMDLYTFSRCEFAILCLSGITAFANLFAKPVLMVNTTMFSFVMGGGRYTEHDRFLPKRFYVRDPNKRRMKRYLTFREIFVSEERCDVSDKRLRDRGIEWTDNTEDEILDAVKEMVARIDGTWIDTEEDEELLEGWQELYEDMADFQSTNPYNFVGGPIAFPPATTFLRAHPYLLD